MNLMTRDSPDYGAVIEPAIDAAVIVALGSNLAAGGRSSAQTLEAALARLSALGLVLVKRSRWWSSIAWPDSSQPPFVNGAVWLATKSSPNDVLDQLHGVEAEFGRSRGAANDARTLDLDLIAYGRLRRQDARMILPHPRAACRAFVMGPVCDLDPRWRHPRTGRRASALFAGATVGADATPLRAREMSLQPQPARFSVSG